MMAELGLEVAPSSEKEEDIALTAVDGRLAIFDEPRLDRSCRSHSFGVSCLKRPPRPLGEAIRETRLGRVFSGADLRTQYAGSVIWDVKEIAGV